MRAKNKTVGKIIFSILILIVYASSMAQSNFNENQKEVNEIVELIDAELENGDDLPKEVDLSNILPYGKPRITQTFTINKIRASISSARTEGSLGNGNYKYQLTQVNGLIWKIRKVIANGELLLIFFVDDETSDGLLRTRENNSSFKTDTIRPAATLWMKDERTAEKWERVFSKLIALQQTEE